MSAERLIASHLRLSSEALAAAQLLLDSGNRNAAYQAEQGIEQIILALAQSEEIHFPRGSQHQVDTMLSKLPDVNSFKTALRPLVWLEAYATTYRYPRTAGGISAPPDQRTLSRALHAARAVLSEVAAHFAVDLDVKATTPAGHCRPPRSVPDIRS